MVPNDWCICGGLGTILMNGLISLENQWGLLLGTWIVNGLFQSMISVGGISMLSQWWAEGYRGKGVGIANFFSGISHVTAYLLPILIVSLWPDIGWRTGMVIPMGVLLIFVIVFAFVAVEKPQDKKLPAYAVHSQNHQKREETLRKRAEEGKIPHGFIFCSLENSGGGALSPCSQASAVMDSSTGSRCITGRKTARRS